MNRPHAFIAYPKHHEPSLSCQRCGLNKAAPIHVEHATQPAIRWGSLFSGPRRWNIYERQP